MTEVPNNDMFDERAITAFAVRLDAYAATLSTREREALMIILVRAMDPVERMRWREAASLLDESEEAVLRSLLDADLRG
jgi:hypothetical protein